MYCAHGDPTVVEHTACERLGRRGGWHSELAFPCSTVTLPYLCAVHLVDIWNVIEALRENALNNLDPNTELSVARLEAVLSTIFYQLNKRMPTTHQIHVEQSIGLLLNFLLAAFDP